MTPQEKADQYGQEYDDLGAQIKDLASSKDKTASLIKGLADKHGQTEGKQTLVHGQRYSVGFITTDPDKVLDHGKLQRALDNDTWVSITTRVVDEKKLSYAIVKGKIKRKVIAACLVQDPRPPQKRVYVKKKGKHETKKKV
jgi:hypothetical protein